MTEAVDGWVHSDGTPCPEYLAPRGRSWWCTTHQMDVRHDDDIHNDAPESPAGASHAGGLSDDQVIRIHALAAAVRSKPLADTRDQLDLASRYARWLKNGA